MNSQDKWQLIYPLAVGQIDNPHFFHMDRYLDHLQLDLNRLPLAPKRYSQLLSLSCGVRLEQKIPSKGGGSFFIRVYTVGTIRWVRSAQQITGMNIRRVRKRKSPFQPKTEQQLAKEKLFEISNLCEEKIVDESQILAIEHVHHHHKVESEHKIQFILRDSAEKKQSRSLGLQDYRTMQSEEAMRIEEPSKIEPNYLIYNTVESNRVFVGGKKKEKIISRFSEESISFIDVGSKKRVETMPIIQQQSYRQHRSEREAAEIKQRRDIFDTIKLFPRANRNNSLQRTYNSLQKYGCRENYIKLKEKVRKEIFDSLNKRSDRP